MKRLSRLVEVNNSNFYTGFQYINYALSTNALTIRLLRNTNITKADLYEDDLYNTEPIFSNSFIQAVGFTVPYNGKMLEVIAEATLDYDEYPKEAKQPLSTFLIYLVNNELKIDNYLLNTSVNHYRSSDYIRALSGSAMCLAQVYLVNPEDLLSNCSISLTQLNGVEIISDIDTSDFIKETAQTAADRNTPRSRFQPKLVITPLSETVEEDGKASCKVECMLNNELCTDANFIIHIEPVDGYVAHKRAQLTNGQVSFDAYALHLKDGELMRIKVGLPHYTGLAECIIPVIAKPTEEVEEVVKTPEELILEMKAAVLSAEEIKEDIKSYSESLITSSTSKTLTEFSTLSTKVDTSLQSMTTSLNELKKTQSDAIEKTSQDNKETMDSIRAELKKESKEMLAELADVRDTFKEVLRRLKTGEDLSDLDI